MGFSMSHEEAFRYQPDWDSIRSRYKCPEWFRDAKFGIFVFWGPASVPAVGDDKYGAWMYEKECTIHGVNSPEYHKSHFGHPSVFGYKDFFSRYTMEHYDPQAWVGLFEASGAKYVVPVAEMHDSYAMYASNHTRWNVVDTGPRRDVMRMLVDEARDRGLKVGLSSHFAFNREFFPKWDPTFDTNDPAYYDLYGPPVNREDPPTQAFLDLWWNRTTDFVEQYEPDILWFDFGLDKPGFVPVHKEILAYYYNKGLEWDKEVVFQDKNMLFESFPEDLIVLDIERGRMPGAGKRPWQTDTAVGKVSWTYIINENYKTTEFLLTQLADIVSKNGNLLLSIGPKADGTIGEDEERILREFGDWLRINGDAIYGTRPWKVFGEGPTTYGEGPTDFNNNHHTEYHDKDSGPEDIRFTAKGDTVYAMALGWPADGIFRIKSLATGNPHEPRKVALVEFLGAQGRTTWEQTEDALVIKAGGAPQCKGVFAFRIEFVD